MPINLACFDKNCTLPINYLDVNATSFQEGRNRCNTGSLLKSSRVHVLWQIQQVSTTCVVTIRTGFGSWGILSSRGTCKMRQNHFKMLYVEVSGKPYLFSIGFPPTWPYEIPWLSMTIQCNLGKGWNNKTFQFSFVSFFLLLSTDRLKESYKESRVWIGRPKILSGSLSCAEATCDQWFYSGSCPSIWLLSLWQL